MGVLKVWDGTSWQSISATSEGAASVYVGPEAPPGTPDSGDMWWDSNETAPGLTIPLGVVDGGTGATSPATARSSLAVPSIGSSTVTAGPPTSGNWARGDQFLDSTNVVWTCATSGTPGTWLPPIGYEYAFNQATAGVTLTSTNPASPQLIIEGTARSYDGTPVIVEFYAGVVQSTTANGQATVVSLWDSTTDLGMIGEVWNVANFGTTIYARRKITPTPGTHNFRIQAWINAGTGGVIYAGAGGTGATQPPTYIRVTKA